MDRADCAFPSRRGAREVWGNPPPACGALWRMPQLGKCARATPRQPAGRLARGSANLGLSLTSRKSALCPTGGVQNALFRGPNLPECAFPSRRDRRMRFSVRVPAQNAPFRRVRFSSPGQTSGHLTEKRTLAPAPHGKPHSAARPVPPPTPADPPHHGSGVCAVAQVVSLSDSVAYGVVAKFGTKLLSQRMDVHPHRIAEQIYVAVPGVGEQLLAADRSLAVT